MPVLYNELRQHPCSVDQARQYTQQIVQQLMALHQRGLPHRALNLHNVWIENHVCTFVPDRHQRVHASLVPPESQQPHDLLAGNMWSLGIMLFMLLTQSPPFAQATPQDVQYAYVQRYGIAALLQRWKVPLPPAPALDLLDHLLVSDPTQRYDIFQVAQHPFLSRQLPPLTTKAMQPELKRITTSFQKMWKRLAPVPAAPLDSIVHTP